MYDQGANLIDDFRSQLKFSQSCFSGFNPLYLRNHSAAVINLFVMSENLPDIVVLSLATKRFAIPVNQVVKVIRAVAVTSIPDAPAAIHGVMDFHAEIIPVINLRQRFGLPAKEISESDRFIIIQSQSQKIALVVDEAEEIRKTSGEDFVLAEKLLSKKLIGKSGLKAGTVSGFLADENGIIVIFDAEHLLSSELSQQLFQFIEMQEEGRL
jgi:purine-binding chemotaxis protein CheW